MILILSVVRQMEALLTPQTSARVHRTDINDYEFNYSQRSARTIVKGRFQNGTIAYIYADELELYTSAYKKTIARMSYIELQIYYT